jgi:ribosomal RNA-processing protein 7
MQIFVILASDHTFRPLHLTLPDMANVPKNAGGFVVLPVEFPVSSVLPVPSKHYIYLKAHDPLIPDSNAARSLFIVNVPVTATELHFKHLFSSQLAAGRVERVDFNTPTTTSRTDHAKTDIQSGRKRKRVTEEDIQLELRLHQLPPVWTGTFHPSSSHALVVFVDRPSMEASLKAAKRAAKLSSRIIWGKGMEDRVPGLGLQRYKDHNRSQYPPRRELLQSVDSYMSAYSKMEEARSRADAKRRQTPDEDGFVTVTKGARGGVVRKEDAKELGEKQKAKNKGLDDFYRFQMRERRKEEQGEFLRKFNEDKRRVDEMKKRRGRLRVSCGSTGGIETRLLTCCIAGVMSREHTMR